MQKATVAPQEIHLLTVLFTERVYKALVNESVEQPQRFEKPPSMTPLRNPLEVMSRTPLKTISDLKSYGDYVQTKQ